MRDLVLAQAPAQQHLFPVAEGGEIHQPLVQILHDRSTTVDLVDAARDRHPFALLGLGEFGKAVGVDPAPVAGDLRSQRRSLGLPPLLLTTVCHELLDQRANLEQLVVGLLLREVARHATPMIPGVVVAGQRVEQRSAARDGLPAARTRRSAVEVFLWSRAGIWLAALIALLTLEPMRNPKAGRWDDPALTHDLGSALDVWARWDSVHFLRIAERGYSAAETAFYPLYPGLLAGLGRAFGGHYVLAGVLISLACTLGAFVLFERLAEERLGGDGARRAIVYLAVFPTALFLQAVYSESLFLLLCLGAFALAERERFPHAGVALGLALLTRPAGLALVPPLLLIAGRRSWQLATALPLVAAYPVLLHWKVGDAWAFAHAEGTWHRHLSPVGPLGGIWDGLRAAWAGVEQLASGSNAHVYWHAVAPDDSAPLRTAAINLGLLGFLLLFLALAVIAWRQFGAPYGLFAVLSLALPLSAPSSRWPLLSLPRFGLTIFPLFLALAWVGGRWPRANAAILCASAILLGVFITEWALWDWVA